MRASYWTSIAAFVAFAVAGTANLFGAVTTAETMARQSKLRDTDAPNLTDVTRMHKVIDYFAQSEHFMGTVLVGHGDGVLLNQSYGYANIAGHLRSTPSTRYRVGSITKQFTAASILLLQQRGRLIIRNPLSQYLGELPMTWRHLTAYQLLTHTSGIPNYTDFANWSTVSVTRQTPESLVALFADKPLNFTPGARWSYSNSGYVLLGDVIQRVSGIPYAEFVKMNLLDPLGLANSGIETTAGTVQNMAAGYVATASGLIAAPYINMSSTYADGDLYSTTEDLLRWERGLFAGKVFSSGAVKEMTTPYLNNYGLGIEVTTVDGHRVFAHQGGLPGFNAFVAYCPDNDLTVVVLANVSGPAADDIAQDLLKLGTGGTVVLPNERKAVSLVAERPSRYVGTFALASGFDVIVERKGNDLEMRTAGPHSLPVFGFMPARLYATSAREFFMTAVDAQVTFVFNRGVLSATEIVIHQDGQDHTATRLP